MSGSSDNQVAYTHGRTTAVEKRVARGERQRKLFWFALACMTVSLMVLGYLVVMLYVGRSASRSYYNRQIRDLSCGLVQFTPPGDPLGDQLRSDYHCPAYRAPSPRPSSTPAPSAAPSRSASPTPQPTPAAGDAQAAPRFPTTPTATVTAPGARVRITDRATRTLVPPASSSPAPTAPPHGLLGGLGLCGLLGLQLC